MPLRKPLLPKFCDAYVYTILAGRVILVIVAKIDKAVKDMNIDLLPQWMIFIETLFF